MARGIFVAVGLALVGIVAWVVVTGGDLDPPGEVVAPSDNGAPAPTVNEPDLEGAAPRADRREAVPAVVPTDEAETIGDGRPESYRRELAGIIGRLVESDGAPAAGLGVELLGLAAADLSSDLASLFDGPPPELRIGRGQTTTDEEGRFQFEGMEPLGHHGLGIDLGGPRATLRFVDRAPNPGQVIDLGDIVLEPFVTFTGKVVDFDDEPVPGARVQATNLPGIIFQFGAQNIRTGGGVAFEDHRSDRHDVVMAPPWMSAWIEKLPIPETRSADDGSFRIEGVPVGLVTLVASKGEFVTLVHGPTPSGAAGGERAVGTLRLDEGDEITGSVRDENGEPVAGAKVMVGEAATMAPALIWPVEETDDAGRFVAPGLRDTDHVVAVLPPNGHDWMVASGFTPGIGSADFVMPARHDLMVVAVDEAGETLAKPELVLKRGDEPGEVPFIAPPTPLAGRVEYAEDGSARVEKLGSGQYSVMVRVPGYEIGIEKVDLSQGPRTLRVVLQPEVRAAVLVSTAATGDPLEWARVSVVRKGLPTEDHLMRSHTTRTDSGGRAELVGLRPANYVMYVQHPGYAESKQEISVTGNAGEQFAVELLRGAKIVGRVHAGGRPPDAPRFVMVERRGYGEGVFFPRFTVTDEEGRFEVDRLVPGRHRLEVYRRIADQGIGSVVTTLDQMDEERRQQIELVDGQELQVDIDLLGTGVDGPVGSLRGHVFLNGVPAEGYSVTVRPENHWSEGKSARTDAAGAFDFGLVPAGYCRVQVEHKVSSTSIGGGQMGSQRIELAADETRDLRFDMRSGSLRGRVVSDVESKPLSNVPVWIVTAPPWDDDRGYSHQSTMSDKQGYFQFERAVEGSYNVSARAEGYAETSVGPVEVPFQGEPPPVEIRVVRGVPYHGMLQVAGDVEYDYLFVWLQRADGTYVGDSDNGDRKSTRFRFDDVAPGTYTLFVSANNLSFVPVEVEVPPSGQQDVVIPVVASKPPPPGVESEGR